MIVRQTTQQGVIPTMIQIPVEVKEKFMKKCKEDDISMTKKVNQLILKYIEE